MLNKYCSNCLFMDCCDCSALCSNYAPVYVRDIDDDEEYQQDKRYEFYEEWNEYIEGFYEIIPEDKNEY